MTTVLTVTRQRRGASPRTHRLLFQEGRFTIRVESEGGGVSDYPVSRALSAVDAVRSSRRLRAAHLCDHTAYTCHEPGLLRPDDLIAALRTAGTDEPAPDDEVDPEDLSAEATCHWFTRHHITVDGRRVYGASGTPLVVQAGNLNRPYEFWPEIISFSWDSSDYAGVGAAGFGTIGVYRPQPNLLAVVVATDESLDIAFEQVHPNTSDLVLARGALDAGIFPDRIYAHLILHAFGHDADDLMPGDLVGTTLVPDQIRALLPGHPGLVRNHGQPQGVTR